MGWFEDVWNDATEIVEDAFDDTFGRDTGFGDVFGSQSDFGRLYDQTEDAIKDVTAEDIIGGFVEFMTGGYADYKDGHLNLETGYSAKAIRDVTKINAGVEDQKKAARAADVEVARRAKARVDKLDRDREDDIRASRSAAATRATARAENSFLGSSGNFNGNNFLGT